MKKGPLALFLAALLLGGLGYWLSAGRRIVDREIELPSDLVSQPAPPPQALPQQPPVGASAPTKTAADLLPPPDPVVQAFARQSDELLKMLPTVEQVKALPPAETHMMPAILLHAAAKIGEQSASVERNPALTQEGMKFFAGCARKEDTEDTLRALCLSNLRKLGERAKLPVDDQSYPPEIKRMADRIKGLL